MSNERPLSHPIFDERHELPINEEDSEGEQNFDIQVIEEVSEEIDDLLEEIPLENIQMPRTVHTSEIGLNDTDEQE